ncbi:MAG: hypothetical protein LBQ44_03965 [Treponema sp.]|nr:hypothetical protein [Treponema sp.]
MLKTIALLSLVLALPSGPVSALPAQKLVYPGDWIYDALTALSMEQKKVFLNGSALTVAQVELILAEIDGSPLSASGEALLDEVYAWLEGSVALSRKLGPVAVDFDPALQIEGYAKSNKDLDWVYGPNDRLPFLSLPVSFSMASYVTLQADISLGENRMLGEAHDNYTNFPFDKFMDDVQNIDTNIPKRAYLSAGFPIRQTMGINFRLGIGDDAFGRSETGSVILSDNMRGVSYASLEFYSPYIKYSADVMELEVTKYLYLHHLQINIARRLSLALVEGVMVNAPFEIRFLNPAMIYHSFTAWKSYADYNEQIADDNDAYIKSHPTNSRIGSLLGIGLDFRPWRHGRFYGLVAMNQLEIGSERSASSTVPDGLAFQAGYESFLPASAGGYWNFGVEGVYTYPYMYILAHKNWSFYRESLEVSTRREDPIREWTGSPFGPDSVALTVWTGYRTRRWSAAGSFLFLAQGENASTDVFDRPNRGYYPSSNGEATALTPSGQPALTYLVKFEGTWTPRDWLSVALMPAVKVVRTGGDTEAGFELVLSARISPKFPPKPKP